MLIDAASDTGVPLTTSERDLVDELLGDGRGLHAQAILGSPVLVVSHVEQTGSTTILVVLLEHVVNLGHEGGVVGAHCNKVRCGYGMCGG